MKKKVNGIWVNIEVQDKPFKYIDKPVVRSTYTVYDTLKQVYFIGVV